MRNEYLAIHLRKSWSDVLLQLIAFAPRHIQLTSVSLIVLLWRSFDHEFHCDPMQTYITLADLCFFLLLRKQKPWGEIEKHNYFHFNNEYSDFQD